MSHRFIKRQRSTPYGRRWLIRCQPCRVTIPREMDRAGARVWIGEHVGDTNRHAIDRLWVEAEWWPGVSK